MDISVKELFESTKLAGLITIDDTWRFRNNIDKLLYDLMFLNETDRDCFFDELKQVNETTFDKLNTIFSFIRDSGFYERKDIAVGEVCRYIEDDSIIKLISELSESEVEEILSTGKMYSVGLEVGGIAYLKETINAVRELSLPIRIFCDFDAEDMGLFLGSLKYLSNKSGYILCIIDDQLNGVDRAKEIIDAIENSEYTDNIISILVTSKDTTSLQKFNKKIHIEYISKSSCSYESFLCAYVKSLYRIMLNKLEHIRMDSMKKTLDRLYCSPNTAISITETAGREGITGFDVILNWLNSSERLTFESEYTNELREVIALSNVLCMVSSQELIEEGIEESEKLYQNAVFDNTVNLLHKPIDLGDVFAVDHNYYILLGQECDLRLRNDGKRKTEVFEFVRARAVDKLKNGVDGHGFEQAIIPNFITDSSSKKMLEIDCGKRYYAKTEIFDLCVYNDSGAASISLDKPISPDMKVLLPEGYNKLYGELQKEYSNYNAVRCKFDQDDFKRIVDFIGLTNENNQAINISDCSITESNVLSYGVQRICRLRKHAHILHTLYLSYRGRQAEESICFSRYCDLKYILGENEYEAQYLYSTNSKENERNRLTNRLWRVSLNDINVYLDKMKMRKINKGTNEVVLNERSTTIDGYRIEKIYDKAKDIFYLKIAECAL